jgi:hypothetical protein
MDLSTGMSVTEELAGDDWDWIALVVHPREVGHLRIKEGSPSRVSNTWGPKRDTFNCRACREIKLHEQRIELRKRSAKGVPDLQRQNHEENWYGVRTSLSLVTMVKDVPRSRWLKNTWPSIYGLLRGSGLRSSCAHSQTPRVPQW